MQLKFLKNPGPSPCFAITPKTRSTWLYRKSGNSQQSVHGPPEELQLWLLGPLAGTGDQALAKLAPSTCESACQPWLHTKPTTSIMQLFPHSLGKSYVHIELHSTLSCVIDKLSCKQANRLHLPFIAKCMTCHMTDDAVSHSMRWHTQAFP